MSLNVASHDGEHCGDDVLTTLAEDSILSIRKLVENFLHFLPKNSDRKRKVHRLAVLAVVLAVNEEGMSIFAQLNSFHLQI